MRSSKVRGTLSNTNETRHLRRKPRTYRPELALKPRTSTLMQGGLGLAAPRCPKFQTVNFKTHVHFAYQRTAAALRIIRQHDRAAAVFRLVVSHVSNTSVDSSRDATKNAGGLSERGYGRLTRIGAGIYCGRAPEGW